MQICGLQKLTALDYPGKLAATVFTGGCNLRCPFCHNAPLVTQREQAEKLSWEDVLSFLASRKGLLKGVVLTGGEPLLHPDAADFLEAVREMDFSVKLDTNGCFPEALAEILRRGLVDYVAMDIKNSLPRYPETVGDPGFDTAPVEESVRILRHSCVDFEFRTTLVREFHTTRDLLSIGRWLEGSPRYFLQQFVDSGNLVGQGAFHAFTPEEMYGFSTQLRPFFGTVELRGV